MDFEASPEERELFARARAFARDHLRAPRAEAFSRARWDEAARFGACGLSVPEPLGGSGLDALAAARMMEAFGEGGGSLSLGFSVGAHLFACAMPIALAADDALAARVVPPLARGERIGANAITEAEAGSDAFALKTRATRDGADYVLDGVKTWVSNAPEADLFLVYASNEPAHGHLGVSAFVVERERDGVHVGAPFEKCGLPAAPTASVTLDEVRVPASNRVGDEGAGADVFRSSMAWERACLLALYVGAAERVLSEVVAFAKERRQFRRPIGKHQAVAHQLAELRVQIDGARLLLYRAASGLAAGRDVTGHVAAAKIAISRCALETGLAAMHLQGGTGMLADNAAYHLVQDALPASVFSGTTEIQKDLVATELGL